MKFLAALAAVIVLTNSQFADDGLKTVAIDQQGATAYFSISGRDLQTADQGLVPTFLNQNPQAIQSQVFTQVKQPIQPLNPNIPPHPNMKHQEMKHSEYSGMKHHGMKHGGNMRHGDEIRHGDFIPNDQMRHGGFIPTDQIHNGIVQNQMNEEARRRNQIRQDKIRNHRGERQNEQFDDDEDENHHRGSFLRGALFYSFGILLAVLLFKALKKCCKGKCGRRERSGHGNFIEQQIQFHEQEARRLAQLRNQAVINQPGQYYQPYPVIPAPHAFNNEGVTFMQRPQPQQPHRNIPVGRPLQDNNSSFASEYPTL